MKNDEFGFTLVEIIVVICIISILSTIAFMNYQKVVAKTQAARVSSNLHLIEDGVITAIIDGMTQKAFKVSGNNEINSSNLKNSALVSYLSPAYLSQVPAGIELSLSARQKPSSKGGFYVDISIQGSPGTEKILKELAQMFPNTLEQYGQFEWETIDSEMLAVKEK